MPWRQVTGNVAWSAPTYLSLVQTCCTVRLRPRIEYRRGIRNPRSVLIPSRAHSGVGFAPSPGSEGTDHDAGGPIPDPSILFSASSRTVLGETRSAGQPLLPEAAVFFREASVRAPHS
jgi:hypothetical protein